MAINSIANGLGEELISPDDSLTITGAGFGSAGSGGAVIIYTKIDTYQFFSTEVNWSTTNINFDVEDVALPSFFIPDEASEALLMVIPTAGFTPGYAATFGYQRRTIPGFDRSVIVTARSGSYPAFAGVGSSPLGIITSGNDPGPFNVTWLTNNGSGTSTSTNVPKSALSRVTGGMLASLKVRGIYDRLIGLLTGNQIIIVIDQ